MLVENSVSHISTFPHWDVARSKNENLLNTQGWNRKYSKSKDQNEILIQKVTLENPNSLRSSFIIIYKGLKINK